MFIAFFTLTPWAALPDGKLVNKTGLIIWIGESSWPWWNILVIKPLLASNITFKIDRFNVIWHKDSEIDDIITIPMLIVGTFAVNRNSVISTTLDRQLEHWMVWEASKIHLAWLGFSDIHSGILEYHINIGSSFMASDLNEVSLFSFF